MILLLCLIGYYIVSRMVLIVDDTYIEEENPFEPAGRRAGWSSTDIPMRTYVVRIMGDLLLILTLFKWISLSFGLVGNRMWRHKVARDEKQREAQKHLERIQKIMAGRQREIEKETARTLNEEMQKIGHTVRTYD